MNIGLVQLHYDCHLVLQLRLMMAFCAETETCCIKYIEWYNIDVSAEWRPSPFALQKDMWCIALCWHGDTNYALTWRELVNAPRQRALAVITALAMHVA
jgi:hypothetical protein